MLKPIFEVMNEMLDEIILTYPTAVGAEKDLIREKLSVLKMMSDTLITEWLKFEDKLAAFQQMQHVGEGPAHVKLYKEAYDKARGYYKLHMFDEAVQQLQQVLQEKPGFYMARLYLALCYWHLGRFEEAFEHIHQFEQAYDADPWCSSYSLS